MGLTEEGRERVDSNGDADIVKARLQAQGRKACLLGIVFLCLIGLVGLGPLYVFLMRVSPVAVLLCVLLPFTIGYFIKGIVIWSRTGLVLYGSTMILSSLLVPALALHIVLDPDFVVLPVMFVAVFCIVAGSFGVFLGGLLTRRRNPERWRKLQEAYRRSSLRDMLLFRHIPDLRQTSSQ